MKLQNTGVGGFHDSRSPQKEKHDQCSISLLAGKQESLGSISCTLNARKMSSSFIISRRIPSSGVPIYDDSAKFTFGVGFHGSKLAAIANVLLTVA